MEGGEGVTGGGGGVGGEHYDTEGNSVFVGAWRSGGEEWGGGGRGGSRGDDASDVDDVDLEEFREN
jgi:hypothetical protein